MAREFGTTLTAIIACYGDAPAVPHMYERLRAVFRKLGVNYEIIFVNDCSPDGAREVLAELAARDRRVVVINHTRNFGSQAAFTSGMRLATGDAVVLLDGDLQDPPELIEDFYHAWRAGHDVVYGVRVRRQAPLFLQMAYKAFYRLFRRLAYVPIPLDAGDFSLLDRRVVEALNSMPESDRFVRGLRAWVGFRQTGVPYVRPERMFGHSTNNLLRNLAWACKAIFSFSYRPINLIIAIGLLTVAGSFAAILVQIALRLLYPQLVPTGFTTLIILMLFLSGMQMLSISILGCYIAHMYQEVKRRPTYIVDSILNGPTAPAVARPEPKETRSGQAA
jgi:dolichol-phosphate mannosyltransferase